MTIADKWGVFWPIAGDVLVSFLLRGFLGGLALKYAVGFGASLFTLRPVRADYVICVFVSFFVGHYVFPMFWLPAVFGAAAISGIVSLFFFAVARR